MVDETEFEIIEIENLEETLTPEPEKTSRGRKAASPKKAKESLPGASLLRALKFISVAQKKVGPLAIQHCMLSGHWAAASNEILTVGVPIEEDLEAFPHTFQLIDALSKTRGNLAITQLSQSIISIASGDFKALVACADSNDVFISAPDSKIINVDNQLKNAIAKVATIAIENSPTIFMACVLLQSNTVVACDGVALMECWHGFEGIPNGLLIPKAAANAVAKCPKNLVGLGGSQSSVTFWFDDNSFIKTQLYSTNYPNYLSLFECESLNLWPLPESFSVALNSIAPFCKDGVVYFKDKMMLSSSLESDASTYKIEGLPNDTEFTIKYLLTLAPFMKDVQFETTRVRFFNENLRGILMARGLK